MLEVPDGGLCSRTKSARTHDKALSQPVTTNVEEILRIAASHYATAFNRGEGMEEPRKVPTRKSILEESCSRGMGRGGWGWIDG